MGSCNSVLSLDKLKTAMMQLLTLPVLEPEGALVRMRSSGLRYCLYGLVQEVEDRVTQASWFRAELELYIERGEFSLKKLGSLADDSTEDGDWDCVDSCCSEKLTAPVVQSCLSLELFHILPLAFDPSTPYPKPLKPRT